MCSSDLSEGASLLIVLAVVAAGVIDGVARQYMGMPPRDDGISVLLGRAPASERQRPALQLRAGSSAADASPLQQFAVESSATTQILLQHDMGQECKEHWNCKQVEQ